MQTTQWSHELDIETSLLGRVSGTGCRSSQDLAAPESSAFESLTDLLILDFLKVVITKLGANNRAHHGRQPEESTTIPLGRGLIAKPSLHFTHTWSAWYEVCCCQIGRAHV